MKDNALRIGLSVVRTLIIAAGAILLALIASNSAGEESYSEGMEAYGGQLDLVYNITVGVLLVCAIAALLFGIVYFLLNFKQRIGTLIGILLFLVIGALSFYVLADDTVLRAYESSGIDVTEGESLFAGGGIFMVYLFGGLTVLAIIWSEVSRIFK